MSHLSSYHILLQAPIQNPPGELSDSKKGNNAPGSYFGFPGRK
jgi:hypothetical protein